MHTFEEGKTHPAHRLGGRLQALVIKLSIFFASKGQGSDAGKQSRNDDAAGEKGCKKDEEK